MMNDTEPNGQTDSHKKKHAFTPEQQAVMDSPADHILVSAAAGSGKTHVMTHHVADRIRRREFDVTEMIVLTFTREAASQMKDRIARVLDDAMHAETEESLRRYLQIQIDLLPSAKIMTIDAFCLDLVQQFAWDLTNAEGELLLSGSDRILDAGEAELLLRDAVQQVIEEAYWHSGRDAQSLLGEPEEQGSENVRGQLPWPDFDADSFNKLTDAYGSGRDDSELIELAVSLYTELRAMPDYREFLKGALEALPAVCDSWPDNDQGRILFDNFHLRLDQAADGLTEARIMLDGVCDIFVKDPVRCAEITRMFEAYLDAVQELTDLRSEYKEGTLSGRAYWDAIVELKNTLPDLSMPRRNKAVPEIGEFLDNFSANIHEVFYSLNGYGTKSMTDHHRFDRLTLFHLDSETIRQQLKIMLPALDQLGSFLLAIDDAYAEAKRGEHSMDFGDDAHFALELLRRDAAGSYVSEHYTDLYIDEYQDTSYLQEAILEALSCQNTFRVGDVKQSIYRFRHARPEIFLQREQDYLSGGIGTMLRLSLNFRSTPGILRGVNEVFSRLMHKQISKLDYRADHMLNPPVPEPADEALPAPDVKIALLVQPPLTDAAKLDARNAEQNIYEQHGKAARMSPDDAAAMLDRRVREQQYDPAADPEHYYVAAEIQKLRSSGVPYADIAVMARSWTVLSALENQLEAFGIPSSQAAEPPAFESYEIKLLVAFLQLLDNARQDIPLVSVLLSPLMGHPFTEEELAQVRIWAQELELDTAEYHPDWHIPTPFFVVWDAFGKAELADTGLLSLQQRARAFQSDLADWRLRERTTSLGDLVQELLHRSRFVNLLADLPDRELRTGRIRAFQVWCERFDSPTKQGVHSLISQLDAIQTNELVAPWMEEGKKDDQVRLMTFHGSKGLEFPYVFLIGLEKTYRFNAHPQAVILDQELGLGFDIRLDGGRIQMRSVLHQALTLKAQELNLAEELNLLYVAMTRAERKLYMVGKLNLTKDGLNLRTTRLLQARDGKDPDLAAVKTLKSNLEAVLLALAEEPGLKQLSLAERFAEPDVLAYDGSINDGTLAEARGESIDWTLISLQQLSLYIRSTLLGEVLGTQQKLEEDSAIEGPSEVAAETASTRENLAAQGEWLRSLKLRRPYPAELATRMPLKFTVTELKRRADLEFEESVGEPARDETGAAVSEAPELGASGMATLLREVSREEPFAPLDLTPGDTGLEPELVRISEEAGLSARERGIALHSFMQYAPWQTLAGKRDEEAFIRAALSLQDKQILSEEEVRAIEDAIPALQYFAASDLLKGILEVESLAANGAVYRELPFTLMLPLSELFPAYRETIGTDRCFVQGMMDLWYENEHELVLVDYKSDRIRGSDEEVAAELTKRYSLQLSIYARALRAARGREVTRSVIWLIPRGQYYIIDHSRI